MTRRSRILVAGIAVVATAWWWHGRASDARAGADADAMASDGSADSRGNASSPAVLALREKLAAAARDRGATDWQRLIPSTSGNVFISGRVIDREHVDASAGAGSAASTGGIADVEVVFKNAQGEASTRTTADGSYRIEVAPGAYGAFVRDDHVITLAPAALVRLPGPPSADQVDATNDAQMPTIIAASDIDHVDLPVVRAGVVHGRVVDASGRGISGAIVEARHNGDRPVLGTDLAESDAGGRFTLRLSEDNWVLTASAGDYVLTTPQNFVMVTAGSDVDSTITVVAGCVISGRVVDAHGKPAGDGALERQQADGEAFGPVGKIAADGTFKYIIDETASVRIRAWPWKSPPSPARELACKPGTHYADVVFQLPDVKPDLAGTLVDADGKPVPFAYIDVRPLDVVVGTQQERTDAYGNWAVYKMPPGHYQVIATTDNLGIASETFASPSAADRLTLGGTGRLTGTTPALADGTFELTMTDCGGDVPLRIAPRMVTIHDGAFAIDGVPSCKLSAVAHWQAESVELTADIPAGDPVELDIGPPHEVAVSGTIVDADNKPVANAQVHVFGSDNSDVEATTDALGRFKLTAMSGGMLIASNGSARSPAIQIHSASGDQTMVLSLRRTIEIDDEIIE